MILIELSHRAIITQARTFREFRILQAKNYSGNRLSKFVRMWMDWQEIKDVITIKSTQNGN